jgi:hypothetical protein
MHPDPTEVGGARRARRVVPPTSLAAATSAPVVAEAAPATATPAETEAAEETFAEDEVVDRAERTLELQLVSRLIPLS